MSLSTATTKFVRATDFRQGWLMIKGQRRPNGAFELAEAPSYLIRRCQQFYGDLYAREAGTSDLTKQQFMVLAAKALLDALPPAERTRFIKSLAQIAAAHDAFAANGVLRPSGRLRRKR